MSIILLGILALSIFYIEKTILIFLILFCNIKEKVNKFFN